MKQKILSIVMILFIILSSFVRVNAIDVSNITISNSGGALVVKNVTAGNESSTLTAQNTYLYGDDGNSGKMSNFITLLSFATAIATVTMFGIFIKHVILFAGKGAEHWMLRRNEMFGLLWSGIATALLGSATLIMALSYNAFKF